MEKFSSTNTTLDSSNILLCATDENVNGCRTSTLKREALLDSVATPSTRPVYLNWHDTNLLPIVDAFM
jgi:hypothetical protein